jgi:hypothetical protein
LAIGARVGRAIDIVPQFYIILKYAVLYTQEVVTVGPVAKKEFHWDLEGQKSVRFKLGSLLEWQPSRFKVRTMFYNATM